MADAPVGLARVAELKVEAAAMSRELGIKRHAALRSLAAREGFVSWEALTAMVGSHEDIRRGIRALGLPTPNCPEGVDRG